MFAPACYQVESCNLACLAVHVVIALGWLLKLAQPAEVCLQLVVSGCSAILIAVVATLDVAVFPFSVDDGALSLW